MGNVPDKNPEAGIAQQNNEQDICIEERPMAKASSRPCHQFSGRCEHGYDDEQFEDDISENFHCAICTNVLKDPVMCFRNEHIFCRACLTKYLAKSQTCPTCIEPLTVDKLQVPPRIVLNCLSELKIHCDFYHRGCREIMQLGKLERHLKECEYAPAVCSNKGCQMEINRRDIILHETSICEMRRVQCHKCTELKQEMEIARGQLTTLTKKLERIEAKQDKLIVDVDDKLNKLEINAQQLETNNEEIKKKLILVVEHLGRFAKVEGIVE